MNFTLYKDLITQDKKAITWVEAGTYPVIRIFDQTRVLIDIGTMPDMRQLTLVKKSKGKISFGG